MAQTLIGAVSSDKADKTITVTVNTREMHPIYKKQYAVTRKYMAHDEKNQAGIGDKVEIKQTRPFSKRKSWELVRIVEKARGTVELRDEVSENFPEPVVDKKEAENDSTRN